MCTTLAWQWNSEVCSVTLLTVGFRKRCPFKNPALMHYGTAPLPVGSLSSVCCWRFADGFFMCSCRLDVDSLALVSVSVNVLLANVLARFFIIAIIWRKTKHTLGLDFGLQLCFVFLEHSWTTTQTGETKLIYYWTADVSFPLFLCWIQTEFWLSIDYYSGQLFWDSSSGHYFYLFIASVGLPTILFLFWLNFMCMWQQLPEVLWVKIICKSVRIKCFAPKRTEQSYFCSVSAFLTSTLFHF